eukprot:TRINITY_DN74707_c0_g1_i1.p1 TRINITY_DN74707_c0_g1~~TRINITY_DN74707_c0_g1_i1.p1  ORF type:complete len:545 (+),score=44.42 TRINITY_DN74707_c0_g1_i1:52-1635(+)
MAAWGLRAVCVASNLWTILGRMLPSRPHEACQTTPWVQFRENWRHKLMTFTPGWGSRDVPLYDAEHLAFLEQTGGNCDSGRIMMYLLIAYTELLQVDSPDELKTWEVRFASLFTTLFVPEAMLDAFPFMGILSYIHIAYTSRQPRTPGPCRSIRTTCDVFFTLVSLVTAHSLGYSSMDVAHHPELVDSAVHFLKDPDNAHDLIGQEAATMVCLLANRTGRRSSPSRLLAQLRDSTWMDALRGPWPVLHISHILQTHWFYKACPWGSFAQWSRTEPPFMICIPQRSGLVIDSLKKTGRWADCDHFFSWIPRKPTATCNSIVEAGANLGACSMLFAVRGFSVIAIEANGWYAEHLRASAQLNGFNNMRILHRAVADAPGKATLRVPADGSLAELSHPSVTNAMDWSKDDFEAQDVRVVTIDQAVGAAPVCFLKIDVEGADLLALRGASHTVAKAQFVSFELRRGKEEEKRQAFSDMEAVGLRIGQLRTDAKTVKEADEEWNDIKTCRQATHCSGDFMAYRRGPDFERGL